MRIQQCSARPANFTSVCGPGGTQLLAAFSQRLAVAQELDIATSRLRLDTLGALPERVAQMQRVRLVVGLLTAEILDAEAHALAVHPAGRRRLRVLGPLLGSGKCQVRAAPLGCWDPDFSIFSGEEACGLVGSHAFGRGMGSDGPLLAVAVRGPAVDPLRTAFESIWGRAHDVTPAVETIVRRALRWSGVPRRVG